MPIYEFQCSKCRKIFEELVMSSNMTDICCPECKSTKVQKLISQTRGTRTHAAKGAACARPASSGFS